MVLMDCDWRCKAPNANPHARPSPCHGTSQYLSASWRIHFDKFANNNLS